MSDPVTRLNAALEGRYRIESELGEGGMATVYLARDEKHNRNVALKVLKPELAAVVGAERFLAEIETTANLQHPHILPLFDSGEADTYLFYVMPYVEGETLRDRLDREHQLPVDDAVQIAKNVAEALDYAHSHGVIHRDIKPANILLQAGKPVISDFGIALAVGVAGGGRLTETGLSLGTPHYMSPEQATGDLSVGAATDVYALGCVLYETLVGEPPHTGSTAQAILGKIVTGDADPVTKHRKAVPANVDASIKKALEKVPADRFPGAQDFARALGDAGFRHGHIGPSLSRPSAVWNPVSLGATAVAVLFAALWLVGRVSPEASTGPPEITRFTIPASDGVVPSGGQMAISPDGRTVVFAGGGQLYRRDLESLQTLPIPGTERPFRPFFSPDGEWIAFFDVVNNVLERVRLDGSGLQTLADAPASTRSGGWREEGGIVFNSSGLGGLLKLEPGGQAERVPGPALVWIDLLPGGRAVIGSWFAEDPNADPQIAIVTVDSGELNVLFPGTTPRYAAGHILYWRAGGIWAVPFDVERLEVQGPPTLIAEGVRSNTSNGQANFTVSDDVLVYQPGEAVQMAAGMLVWVDRAGNEEALDIDPGLYHWPRISPDGTRVAMTRVEDNADVWVHDLRTGVSLPLTVSPALDDAPVWTSDGERIVFRSTRDGASNLYWRRADGGDEVMRLTDGPMNQRPVAVTPDGTRLLFEEMDPEIGVGESLDVWSMPLEPGATPMPLLREDYVEGHPALSPNGRFIAYESSEMGYPEIFVRSYPDLMGGLRVSTLDIGVQNSARNADPREGRAPVFSRDGTELFYQSGTAVVSVPVSTEGSFSSGAPRVAFAGTGWPFVGEGRHYDVHPEGQRFIRIRLPDSASSGVSSNDLVVVMNWTRLLEDGVR